MSTFRYIGVTFGIVFLSGTLAQDGPASVVGRYADGYGRPERAITDLKLNADSSFELTTVDPVFSNTHQRFTNSGRWAMSGDTVVLNPGLTPLTHSVHLRALDAPISDSLSLSINYTVRQVRADGSVVQEGPFAFDMVTIYLNKKNKWINLVRHPKDRTCLHSPKVKDQTLVEQDNSVRIPMQELERLGFFTYGIDEIVWLDVPEGSRSLEVVFVQEVDATRAPRNRNVVMKGSKAHFYIWKGEIDRGLTALEKY